MFKYLILTQGVCIFLIFVGITIEVTLFADIGYFLITLGSLIFALTTKIESYLINKRKD